MFSTKRLFLVSCALVLAASQPAVAQPKPADAHPQPASAHVPSADLDLGTSAMSPKPAVTTSAAPSVTASSAAAVSQPAAPTTMPVAQAPRLSIDDIDQKIRRKIDRQLSGDGDGPTAIAIPNLNSPAPTRAIAPAPFPSLVVRTEPVRSRAEKVKFVGAFNDMTGMSVLYEFRSAFYHAHVGTALLNGWRVSKVDGFLITVTEGSGKGARTWTEPISGGEPAPEPQESGPAPRTLTDLSGALPLPVPLSSIGH